MRRELTGFGGLVSILGMASRNDHIDPIAAAVHRGYHAAAREFEIKAAEGAILGSDGFLTSSPLASATIGTIPRASLAGHIIDAARPAGGWHQRYNVTDTAKLTAGVITEAVGVPVHNTAASSIILNPEKIGIALVYPHEMLADPEALAVIESDFAIVAQRGADAAILTILAADSNLTLGATANSATDMRALLGALGDLSAIAPPILAASPATLLHIGTVRDSGGWVWPEVGLHGGHMIGCPIFACDALSDGVIRAISGEAVAAKFGPIEISASGNAAVQMTDSPTQDASAGTGSTAVSMFQSASVAVRYLISYAVVKLRDTASAELDGVLSW